MSLSDRYAEPFHLGPPIMERSGLGERVDCSVDSPRGSSACDREELDRLFSAEFADVRRDLAPPLGIVGGKSDLFRREVSLESIQREVNGQLAQALISDPFQRKISEQWVQAAQTKLPRSSRREKSVPWGQAARTKVPTIQDVQARFPPPLRSWFPVSSGTPIRHGGDPMPASARVARAVKADASLDPVPYDHELYQEQSEPLLRQPKKGPKRRSSKPAKQARRKGSPRPTKQRHIEMPNPPLGHPHPIDSNAFQEALGRLVESNKRTELSRRLLGRQRAELARQRPLQPWQLQQPCPGSSPASGEFVSSAAGGTASDAAAFSSRSRGTLYDGLECSRAQLGLSDERICSIGAM